MADNEEAYMERQRRLEIEDARHRNKFVMESMRSAKPAPRVPCLEDAQLFNDMASGEDDCK